MEWWFHREHQRRRYIHTRSCRRRRRLLNEYTKQDLFRLLLLPFNATQVPSCTFVPKNHQKVSPENQNHDQTPSFKNVEERI
jgi:hypothetical protein